MHGPGNVDCQAGHDGICRARKAVTDHKPNPGDTCTLPFPLSFFAPTPFIGQVPVGLSSVPRPFFFFFFAVFCFCYFFFNICSGIRPYHIAANINSSNGVANTPPLILHSRPPRSPSYHVVG